MRRAQGCKKVGEERSPKMDPEKGERGAGWLGGWVKPIFFIFISVFNHSAWDDDEESVLRSRGISFLWLVKGRRERKGRKILHKLRS